MLSAQSGSTPDELKHVYEGRCSLPVCSCRYLFIIVVNSNERNQNL